MAINRKADVESVETLSAEDVENLNRVIELLEAQSDYMDEEFQDEIFQDIESIRKAIRLGKAGA